MSSKKTAVEMMRDLREENEQLRLKELNSKREIESATREVNRLRGEVDVLHSRNRTLQNRIGTLSKLIQSAYAVLEATRPFVSGD